MAATSAQPQGWALATVGRGVCWSGCGHCHLCIWAWLATLQPIWACALTPRLGRSDQVTYPHVWVQGLRGIGPMPRKGGKGFSLGQVLGTSRDHSARARECSLGPSRSATEKIPPGPKAPGCWKSHTWKTTSEGKRETSHGRDMHGE